MSLSADDGVLMLVEKGSHHLSFFERATMRRFAGIDLPHYSHEIAVSADRRHVFVGHYGVRISADIGLGGTSVTVIDIAAHRVVRSIDCRPYGRLHGLALDDRGRLHVLSEERDVLLRFDDPLDAALPSRALATGGIKGHLFALSRDGRYAYCSNLLSHTVTRIRPEEPAAPPVAVHPGDKPEGLCLSPDERTLYVANRESATLVAIDTQTMAVTRSMQTRKDPLRVYVVDGSTLLVANCGDRSLSIVDALAMRETGCLPLAGIPVAAHVPRGSGRAFVSLTTDECIEVDLASLTIVRTFATKSEPDCCFLLSTAEGGLKPC